MTSGRGSAASGCRPRPVCDAPLRIPDSKVAQFADLLDETGIPALIDVELAGRPGPPGLPIRTVLVGLMLAVHYTGKATIAQAWRLLASASAPPPAPCSTWTTSVTTSGRSWHCRGGSTGHSTG